MQLLLHACRLRHKAAPNSKENPSENKRNTLFAGLAEAFPGRKIIAEQSNCKGQTAGSRTRTAVAVCIAVFFTSAGLIAWDGVKVIQRSSSVALSMQETLQVHGLDLTPSTTTSGNWIASGALQIPASVLGVAWTSQLTGCKLSSRLAANESNASHCLQPPSSEGLCVQNFELTMSSSRSAESRDGADEQHSTDTKNTCHTRLSLFGLSILERAVDVEQPQAAPAENAEKAISVTAHNVQTSHSDNESKAPCFSLTSLLPSFVKVVSGARVSVHGTQRIGVLDSRSEARAGATNATESPVSMQPPSVELLLSDLHWTGPAGCVQGSAAVYLPTNEPAAAQQLLGMTTIAEAEAATKTALNPSMIESTLSQGLRAVLEIGRASCRERV